PRELRDLGVINAGTTPPEWRITAFPGGDMLQGRQATSAGEGTVFFSCDDTQTTFGSVRRVTGQDAAPDAQRWRHALTLDGREEIPLATRALASRDGVVRATFAVPPDVVRRAMSAKRIGHRMTPPNSSPSIDVGVDVDEGSALMVKTFL